MGLRTTRNVAATLACAALLLASCGGDGAPSTSTTTTTLPTSTTTTEPPQPDFVVAREGDENPAVRAIQFLLVCNGYQQTVVDGRDETLVPDGVYGPITTTIVDRVQRDLGLDRDGTFVDSDLYERLSSTCENVRSVFVGENTLSVVAGGYASPDLPDTWTFWAQPGQRVTLTPSSPPLQMGLYDPEGAELNPVEPTEGFTVDILTAGSHMVRVNTDEPLTYEVTVSLPPHHSVLLLQSTGLDYVDFGDRPDGVIQRVGAVLGDPSADTGWNEPGNGCVRWRRVEWGAEELWLYFTDAGEDATGERTYNSAGVEHFAVWQMNHVPDGGTLPALATPSGLVVGDSAADVEDVYGDRVEIDGTVVSIVDGIIVGELDQPGGTLMWLRSGATLCADPGTGEDDEGDGGE